MKHSDKEDEEARRFRRSILRLNIGVNIVLITAFLIAGLLNPEWGDTWPPILGLGLGTALAHAGGWLLETLRRRRKDAP